MTTNLSSFDRFIKYLNVGLQQMTPFCNCLMADNSLHKSIIYNLDKYNLLAPMQITEKKESCVTFSDRYFGYVLQFGFFGKTLTQKEIDENKDATTRNLYMDTEKLSERLTKTYLGWANLLNGTANKEEIIKDDKCYKKIALIIENIQKNEKAKQYNAVQTEADSLYDYLYSLNIGTKLSFFANFKMQRLIYKIEDILYDELNLAKYTNDFGDYIPKYILDNLPSSCFAIAYEHFFHEEYEYLDKIKNELKNKEVLISLGYLIQRKSDHCIDVLWIMHSKTNNAIVAKGLYIDYKASNKFKDLVLYNTFLLFGNVKKTPKYCNDFYKKYINLIEDTDMPGAKQNLSIVATALEAIFKVLFVIQDDSMFETKIKQFQKQENTNILDLKQLFTKKNKKKYKTIFSKNYNIIDPNRKMVEQIKEFNKKVREYKKSQATEKRKMKPHIRRGHIHTFYKGKRVDGAIQESFTKWLKPIFVNRS